MQRKCIQIAVLIMAAGSSAACQSATAALSQGAVAPQLDRQYPSEILGTWNLGPKSCKLPVNPDSDSPIRIKPHVLEGYEHTEDPQSVIQLSKEPLAWRIVETSEIAPAIQTIGIYVLKDDHLVITTGDEVTRYRRCR